MTKTETRSYIYNPDTGKIELQLCKADFKSLPPEAKKLLQRNFLFKCSKKCWISRCSDPNLSNALQAARTLGFFHEERSGEVIG